VPSLLISLALAGKMCQQQHCKEHRQEQVQEQGSIFSMPIYKSGPLLAALALLNQ
jgi:hypothetical protein